MRSMASADWRYEEGSFLERETAVWKTLAPEPFGRSQTLPYTRNLEQMVSIGGNWMELRNRIGSQAIGELCGADCRNKVETPESRENEKSGPNLSGVKAPQGYQCIEGYPSRSIL
jgi:hypothetical protein